MSIVTHPAGQRSSAGSRFALVDGLRGIAALAVVLFHAQAGGHVKALTAAFPPMETLAYGHLGVAVFFVLSGFVVAHTLFRTRMTWGVLERFVLRRSLRLDPPYWVAIGLCLAAALAGGSRSSFDVAAVLAHLVYLQDLLGVPQINAVFWTLCLEIQFYLGYAALLMLGRNAPGRPLQGPRTAILLAGAAAVSLLWPLGLGPWVPPGLFLPLWHGFLLGVGAYWAWREPACRAFVALFGLLVCLGAWIEGSAFSAVYAGTAVILYAAARTGRLATALDWRWLQGLGTISYSLYLIHNPVTAAVFRVAKRFGLEAAPGAHAGTALGEALWLIVAVLACIACAAGLWWAVERPSQSLSRRIGSRPPQEAPAPVGAGSLLA